jgi:hypothetical protein
MVWKVIKQDYHGKDILEGIGNNIRVITSFNYDPDSTSNYGASIKINNYQWSICLLKNFISLDDVKQECEIFDEFLNK